MMNSNMKGGYIKNQKGFTLVEGLLIVLVVAVIGFGGYTVWNNNQDDESDGNEITQSQQEASQSDDDSEASNQETANLRTAPDGWQVYSGEGFSFFYPESWDNLGDLPDDWQPAVLSTANGHEVGGGFGPVVAYDSADGKWYIKELGRFPVDRQVGDEFDLENRTSKSGVVVYDYTQGDGPFSSTTLLFVSGENMVTIGLPSVCSGSECSEESTYDRGEIISFSEQISESVEVE